MIHVIASIRARSGQRDALAEAFRKILDRVRAKPGCLEYGLAVHAPSGLAGQAPYSEHELTIVEKWEDLAALHAHLADAVYLEWFREQTSLIDSASMQVLDAL